MKKSTYMAPEMETLVIRIEENFLDSFGTGTGSASANKMESSSWSSWDSE